MGVKLEETYPYLLNRKGLKTYNLGVQGSAPVQWLGYFRKFGIQMKPKLVLIGYLPTVYERESIFFHRTNQELPSAIGRIAKRNRRFEIRNQVHFVTTAIIYYTTSIILPDLLNQYGNIACMVDPRLSDDPRCLSNTQVEGNTEFTIPYFSRYKSEYDRVKKLDDPNIIINSREWKSMLDQFLLVKRESDKIGAKVYIIFFPHREIVYFERALNKPLPSPNFSSVEEEHLQRFAVENNIFFLNSIPIFREYIKTVDSKTPLENYPFLTVDGHLSKLGNSLLADFIFNNIKDRK
ncbi:hypothetical protein LPTSP4_03100 [Leptospira ryugenii]|uniref:AlgX/AlgJ SGNH hydrolase-like domain-containing protein n=1 Tax=Leptospira ryugenii TaxID=1917863 RepID=A0A2P2DW67_9LEPT|nr:hypothetical protein [Leptospira ryugenii]GBF48810.1 hypothetical protein LPTSP4_03100 [Leptospira ryugenii]